MEPEFLEGVGLEDRTAEVLRLLEKQPATVLYVYLGSLAKGVAALTSGGFDAGRPGGVLFVLGLLATIGLTVVIARRATRALRGRLAAQDGAGPGRSAQ